MTDTKALGERVQSMTDALAGISAEPGKLTRLFLSPEHKRAAALVGEWMERAGLVVHMDSLGTIHGLFPVRGDALRPARRLLIGSHIDTVIDAGRFDGNLGVVAGIVAVEEIIARGIKLPFALEVLAFGDEEGVRFPKTLLSSSAIAGAIDEDVLDMVDADGVSCREALIEFGLDPIRITTEAYNQRDVLGYLELHIEQGPVLEHAGEPLGAVTAIASQARYRFSVRGTAGHAGTVPMAIRHDALTAAAEIVLAIEQVAKAGEAASLVATVGEMKVLPGASNVIPGSVEFSLDLRAASDEARTAAAEEIFRSGQRIGGRRGAAVDIATVHQKPVALCAPRLKNAIAAAIRTVTGAEPRELMSGAGHDGQAMIHLTDIGMIFVRCRGGVSHNPLEFSTIADIGLATEALIRTITNLAGEER
jgi:allantoate deiminase